MLGYYKCECGQEFTEPNKFNGHKSHCKVHLGYDKYINRNVHHMKKMSAKGAKAKHEKTELKKLKELSEWIAEEHTCERCGKVMTEKYGSGRFCSRSCANSRVQTDEINYKRSETAKNYCQTHKRKRGKWTANSTKKMLETKLKNGTLKRKKDDIYVFEDGTIFKDEVVNRKQGWQSRKIKNSYAEQFWLKVFKLNGVNYIREFCVHNGMKGTKAAVFKLDFLIEDVLDIEIDGSQHEDEIVKQKDIRRDNYLTSLGFIVYRITWINPNNDKNKQLVKEQIDKVLKFIQNFKENSGCNSTVECATDNRDT